MRIYGSETFRLRLPFQELRQIIVVVTVVQDRLMSSKMPCSNYHLDFGQSSSLVSYCCTRCTKKNVCGIIEFSVFLLSCVYPSKDLKPLRHTNKREMAAALQQLPQRRLKALQFIWNI